MMTNFVLILCPIPNILFVFYFKAQNFVDIVIVYSKPEFQRKKRRVR
jgi:hypothetical protein